MRSDRRMHLHAHTHTQIIGGMHAQAHPTRMHTQIIGGTCTPHSHAQAHPHDIAIVRCCQDKKEKSKDTKDKEKDAKEKEKDAKEKNNLKKKKTAVQISIPGQVKRRRMMTIKMIKMTENLAKGGERLRRGRQPRRRPRSKASRRQHQKKTVLPRVARKGGALPTTTLSRTHVDTTSQHCCP
jgi:hypothetical protein